MTDSKNNSAKNVIDEKSWAQRRERLTKIFSSMANHAMEQATFRCPYKNRYEECTAKFGCRNQRLPRTKNGMLRCGSDDKIDYRSAWETMHEADVDKIKK